MKLSNFEWTDKETIKWFIMLHSGHEGPYSLQALKQRHEKKNLSLDSRVWAEGLTDPITVRILFDRSVELPPLPIMDDFSPPPLPDDEEIVEERTPEIKKVPKKSTIIFLGVATISLLGTISVFQWLKGQEKIAIRRYPHMSLELHQKIQEEVNFQGWTKKIFFKEYVPYDYTHIWFVTAGFQKCQVEATFKSIDGKLLTSGDQQVVFKSKTMLTSHVADFDRFEFSMGQKIIPGLYEVDIAASNCQWDTLSAKLGNYFSPPDDKYMGRMKVVLYHKGAVEYNAILDKIIKRKMLILEAQKKQDDYFWQSLQEKLQTLLAITLQIESFFIELLAKDSRKFPATLKEGVEAYTKKFGHTLTRFVISNEEYFHKIPSAELARISQGRDYESLIRLTGKNIGLESMKIIEGLQKLERPRRVKLAVIQDDVRRIFTEVKADINQKIIDTSDDQSPQP